MKHPRAFVHTVTRSKDKCDITMDHLNSLGITAERFMGIDSRLMNLSANNLFERDGVSMGRYPDGSPVPGERIGIMPTGGYLGTYMMWKVLSYLPEDEFWCLEDDAEFPNDWEIQYRKAMSNLPTDWDIVYIGSCCTKNKPAQRIGGMNSNLWDVRYPMCNHGMQIRKKALPVLLEVHQHLWAPLDIAMLYDSLPKLRVFTILPRLVSQRGTFIPV